MRSIWMGIAPGSTTTRVVAMAGPSETILKAQLSKDPVHPRALATLLEALALWEGQPGPSCAVCGRRGLFVRLQYLSGSVYGRWRRPVQSGVGARGRAPPRQTPNPRSR